MPIKINGATSGSLTIKAPDTGSDVEVDLIDSLAAKLGTLSVNAQTGTTYTLATSDPQKVVTMTNAAASTVTIPTNATAAIPVGSSVQIVNLSTGVNTTVSPAGGVTLNGGTVVLSPGSSATLVKVATDAWIVQGQGAPGLTLVASGSVSAASSISVNSCFSSTYDWYRITFFGTMSNASTELWMRMRASGSDLATGTAYRYGGAYHLWATTTMAALGSAGANFWRIGFVSTAGNPVGKVIDIGGPFLTEQTRFVSLGPDEDTNITYTGRLANAVSYDGFSIIPAAGTITGTVRVYGHRNS